MMTREKNKQNCRNGVVVHGDYTAAIVGIVNGRLAGALTTGTGNAYV